MSRNRLLLLILLLGMAVFPVQGQRGGGGGGGRGGGGGGRNLPPGMSPGGSPQRRDMMQATRALPVADIWTELTLGMEVGTVKAAQLKSILSEAYNLRKALLKEAREEDTWAYTKAQMQKLERELWPKINVVLSRKEWRTLDRALRFR